MKDTFNQIVVTDSAEATIELGKQYAHQLAPGDCLVLVGDLGAGKTTFIQGLATGLGVKSPVNSPTYLIVQEYEGQVPLFHVDAYRLHDASELEEIGFDEYLNAGGIVAVEWGDKVPQALPKNSRWIVFDIEGRSRKILFHPPGQLPIDKI